MRSTTIRVAAATLACFSVVAAGCSTKSKGTTSSGDAKTAKVAFLMPDEASTRYEQHDKPGFVAEMKTLCAKCQVLYQNADADATKQQQQFQSVLSQGVKAIVIDPVDSTGAVSLVNQAKAKGVKVIAYDRPIPKAKLDYYVSFNNEAIGKAIASSLVQHLKSANVSPSSGGLLEVNGSPTDAAAGLIKKGIHEGLAGGGYKTLAEYDTPDWDPSKAQQWVSGQVSRFHKQILGVVAANDGTGGGTISAFKAGGLTPIPPVTGNDATTAGLQLIIAGDQYNTISKPSEIVAGAAAKVVWGLLNNKKPKATATLFGSPAQLFTPTLVTAQNLKQDVVDKSVGGKPIATAAQLCGGRYATGCSKLGIT
ncbi:sugar ABC transporter substrate-binding protein [uncultured Jatrophihabitans sp.]|uniref:ABC transporter substrate-binding protein n=1 Tax=uncultured Jatrophihabitans sp. TaxID=1610747 RepID=UPI0035CC1325